MGGRPKALLTLGEKNLLEHAVACFRAGGIADIRVVTGHGHEAVAASAGKAGVKCVYNPDYERGMFSSVRAAFASLRAEQAERRLDRVSAAFFLPVDAALLRPAVLRLLLLALEHFKNENAPDEGGRPDNAVIVPVARGRTGHPPLIGSAHWQNLVAWRGDFGLRGYLASLLPTGPAEFFLAGRMPDASGLGASPVVFLPVADNGVLLDIDTPADLEAARAAIKPALNGGGAAYRADG
jgi:CTP:molybdopterin cytidylyltransferase MocA